MNFVVDQLLDGRKFRSITSVDNFGRKGLAIHAELSIKGNDVVAIIDQRVLKNGYIPKHIKVGTVSEFISKVLDLWV